MSEPTVLFDRMPAAGSITGTFGQWYESDRGRWQHRGVDIGCPTGTPVYAPAPGIVAKNEAARAELVRVKAQAELRHFRRGDGTCAFPPPCPWCSAVAEADWAIAFLDEERKRWARSATAERANDSPGELR